MKLPYRLKSFIPSETMKFKELDIVIIKHEISEYGLSKGDVGTIVEVYGNGEAYEVEFTNKKGETTALLTLDSSDISPRVNMSRVDWTGPVLSGFKS